jgi:flagellar hook-length control protein FliK
VIPMVAAPVVPAMVTSAASSSTAPATDAPAEAGAAEGPESPFLTALRAAMGKADEAAAEGAALVGEVDGEVEGETGEGDGEGDEEVAEAAAAEIATDAATQLAMVTMIEAPIETVQVEVATEIAPIAPPTEPVAEVAPIAPQVDLAAIAAETASDTEGLASDTSTDPELGSAPTETFDVEELVPVTDAETMPNITPQLREQGPVPPDQPIAVDEVAPTAESNTSMKTEPWQQMVEVLRPIKQFADGTHRLSIQLRPEDMGTINVELAVNKGTLSLHVVADTAATRDAINASLSQLRSEIEAGGVRTGSFGVGQQTAGDRQQTAASQRNARSVRSYALAGIDAIDLTQASTAPTASHAAMDGRLDLRI